MNLEITPQEEQAIVNAKGRILAVCEESKHLQHVIAYMRHENIGMVKGDGELTGYINALISRIFENAEKTRRELGRVVTPEELPF